MTPKKRKKTMKINIIAWITIAVKKRYRVCDITKIQEDIADFLTALKSRKEAILWLFLFLPLYPAELQHIIEFISPII